MGHAARTLDGVFDDLGQVGVGDEIVVHADEVVRYRVVATDVVPVEAFVDHAADIYRTTGDAGVVLMTCSGWDGQEYATTTIVRAILS